MKFLSLLSIILLFSFGLRAQTYKVSGTVFDSSSQQALIGANIALESTYDASIIKGTSTDVDGKFSLDVAPGSYRLVISYVGFKEQKKRLFVQDKDVDLGKVLLSESISSEVTVEGRIPPAVLKGDTVEYNANAFKTNPDATAEDLVEKMPGVSVQNGKVQAQGEDVKQVLLDGKPFMGGDPKASLKNIPAEMIDRVQVFDQASDQSRMSGFDDGNTQKTINIISKPEYRSGTFGRVFAAGGYDDEFKPGGERYKLGGVLNSFKGDRRITVLGQFNNINEQNFASDDLAGVMSGGGSGGPGGGRGGMSGGSGGGGGRGGWGGGGSNVGQFLINDQGGITSTNAAGINYADKWGKKMDVSGSYFFNYTQNNLFTSSDQQYVTAQDSGMVYSKEETSVSNNMNHRANFRLEYKINEKNSLTIAPRFSLQLNEGSSNLIGETTRSGNLLNGSDRVFNSDVNAWTFSNAISYSRGFEKKGRAFTISLNNDHKKNDATSNLLASNTLTADASLRDTFDQKSDLNQFETTLSSRLEYSEPIGKNSQLQIQYNPSISFNNGDKTTYSYDQNTESYNTLDTFLSSVSKNVYHAEQAGLGWRYFKDKVNFQARVNFQWAGLSVDQTYPTLYNKNLNFYSVLPFASLRYAISKTKNLRIFYRSNTNAPSITQLQEAVNNSNPLQLTLGNSALKQEDSHRFNIHYSAPNPEKNTMFFTMLSASYTHNYIANSTFIANSDTTLFGVAMTRGSQITRPENMSNRISASSFTTIGLPIKSLKSNLNFNVSAAYNRTPGLINGLLNYAHTPSGSLGITLSSNISTKLDFTLSSNSSLNTTVNSLNTSLNSKFFNQNSKVRLYWNPWKSFVFRTDVSHQLYSGLSDGFAQNFILWNASIATKVFKNQQGELSLLVFDILGQNNSIARNFTETYIETTTTTVLQRYLMLQFTYKFKPKKGDISLDKEKEDLERMKMYDSHRSK